MSDFYDIQGSTALKGNMFFKNELGSCYECNFELGISLICRAFSKWLLKWTNFVVLKSGNNMPGTNYVRMILYMDTVHVH